jgi:CRP/FNR family transcriptional regulator
MRDMGKGSRLARMRPAAAAPAPRRFDFDQIPAAVRRLLLRKRKLKAGADGLTIIQKMAIPQRCMLCPVQASSLCGAVSEEAARALSGITHRLRMPAGRTFYGASRSSHSFAIIISGVVKLVVTKPDGRQQIVGLQFPSDFVGRPLSNHQNLSAEAATTLELCCFSGQAFEGLMREYPDLERALLARVLADLDASREWAFLLGRTSAQEKVATLLHHIAERMTPIPCGSNSPPVRDVDAPVSLTMPLSRMEMAECLGLRLETVCRQISQLKAQDIIATSGRRQFEILDMKAIRQLSENVRPLTPETAEI